ncbi:hypothetical protein C8R45DRAFT_1017556 [Mycena sanguinolenta]|nr:hypothetical protein C8R45DRAFT_1017556 [Mycena sanguinolenta]
MVLSCMLLALSMSPCTRVSATQRALAGQRIDATGHIIAHQNASMRSPLPHARHHFLPLPSLSTLRKLVLKDATRPPLSLCGVCDLSHQPLHTL